MSTPKPLGCALRDLRPIGLWLTGVVVGLIVGRASRRGC